MCSFSTRCTRCPSCKWNFEKIFRKKWVFYLVFWKKRWTERSALLLSLRWREPSSYWLDERRFRADEPRQSASGPDAHTLLHTYTWLTRLNDSPPLCRSVCCRCRCQSGWAEPSAAPLLTTYTHRSPTPLCPLPFCSVTLWFACLADLTLVVCCFYHFYARSQVFSPLASIVSRSYTPLLIQRPLSAQLCAKVILLARIRAPILVNDFACIRHFSLKRYSDSFDCI